MAKNHVGTRQTNKPRYKQTEGIDMTENYIPLNTLHILVVSVYGRGYLQVIFAVIWLCDKVAKNKGKWILMLWRQLNHIVYASLVSKGLIWNERIFFWKVDSFLKRAVYTGKQRENHKSCLSLKKEKENLLSIYILPRANNSWQVLLVHHNL